MRLLIFFIAFLITLNSYSQIFFNDEASNIGFNEHCGTSILGTGLSFVDYDGDGWDDITLTGTTGAPLRFYKNFQGLFFEELLITPQITHPTRSVTWVDFDNDGDKDLFITSDEFYNRLFENTDSGLIEITVQAGFPTNIQFTYGASWGDINNDGCLDVYISNRIVTGNTITNYLYQNNCDGTFTDVTDSVGLTNAPALTFCSGFIDINNDGWQDIYVANDKFEPNFMYKNNGDGTFTDISASSGTDVVVDAMSVTVDDFNSDGFLDIYVTNTPGAIATPSFGNVLFKNNGDETFTNIAVSSGTLLDSFAWGASFFDAENDGDLDLYVSCSYDGTFMGYPSAAFYENQSDETFTEPTNIGFSNDSEISYSNAIGDLNNDGKTDIIVMNSDDTVPFVWNNQTTTTNNYIGVTIEGTVSNRDGVGSLIEISVDGEKQYRYVMCGEGYLAQNSFKEIFGVGNSTAIIDYVKIKWLSGIEDTVTDVAVNQVIDIKEGTTLSISDVELPVEVDIFPNPSDGQYEIVSNNIIDTITIYSISGRKLQEYHTGVKRLDLSTYQSGLYLVEMTSEGRTSYKKIIKK